MAKGNSNQVDFASDLKQLLKEYNYSISVSYALHVPMVKIHDESGNENGDKTYFTFMDSMTTKDYSLWEGS